MRYPFEGKVALVTGAASGIGRATAIAFARHGASVIVADVNRIGGDETVEAILAAGGKAVFAEANVVLSDAAVRTVQLALETYGRLDFAHNNAGVNSITANEWDDDTFGHSLAVNLNGVMYGMREQAAAMLKTGGGAIVNTSSINGLVGNPRQPGYTASKHGVVGLTRTAALRWAREGIRVNCVCPGVVNTPMVAQALQDPQAREAIEKMTPMGRIADPKEIAEAVLWLCSEYSSFVTGHALVVDGGATAV